MVCAFPSFCSCAGGRKSDVCVDSFSFRSRHTYVDVLCVHHLLPMYRRRQLFSLKLIWQGYGSLLRVCPHKVSILWGFVSVSLGWGRSVLWWTWLGSGFLVFFFQVGHHSQVSIEVRRHTNVGVQGWGSLQSFRTVQSRSWSQRDWLEWSQPINKLCGVKAKQCVLLISFSIRALLLHAHRVWEMCLSSVMFQTQYACLYVSSIFTGMRGQ